MVCVKDVDQYYFIGTEYFKLHLIYIKVQKAMSYVAWGFVPQNFLYVNTQPHF